MGIAFVPGLRDIPAAIAPSAVGIRIEDLVDHSCPKLLSVMVIHSSRDSHFPAQYYGKTAIKWWAHCNRCNNQADETLANGCIIYTGCANGVKTWYCETNQRRSTWPGLNRDIIGFFSTATRSTR
jgi:polyhydroxybutyrate depolymerase